MNNIYNTFILKICNEGTTQPRGSIQHVSSQEMKHFQGFLAMNDFISQHIKLSEKDNDLRRSKNE
jgi:hypothetical protein